MNHIFKGVDYNSYLITTLFVTVCTSSTKKFRNLFRYITPFLLFILQIKTLVKNVFIYISIDKLKINHLDLYLKSFNCQL